MMGAVLIVTQAEAGLLHQQDASSAILQILRSAGAALYPMPAFAAGEPGERTFNLEIADQAAAGLCARLTALPGVEACYTKPSEEPP